MQEQSSQPFSDAQFASSPLTETANAFAADWHPHLGARLAVFPRNLWIGRLQLWPDLLTFVEEAESRQLLYCSAEPSQFCARLAFAKCDQHWHLFVYRELELEFVASADSLAALERGLRAA